ncbi:MAG TPA: SRPBCC family protein [Acidimicrobiia bacterium]|nr:SRPBCC family protein [Acidimicrobiia bacterium]
MSTNVITVDAPPSVVWAVLSDPPTYEYWVVGNKEIRRHDGDWPEPGAVFHHKVGFGPLTISDKSISLEAEPLRRLVMQVRALPVGTGIVTFELEPSGTGTKVVMGEATESGPAKLVAPVLDRLAWLRNAETLRRLRRCAEKRHQPTGS